jgi:hypothetical protein
MLFSMNDLYGFTIGASDGDIGTVNECYFDDVSFTVRYVVVDTGGWLSGRKVLLSPIAFRGMDREHRRITAALTKAQVEQSPDIETDKPVARQHEAAYHRYYDYVPYWAGSMLWGMSPLPYLPAWRTLTAAEAERERRWDWEARERDNPHLRSSRTVTGYHMRATDGDIGHVADYLVDDQSWSIRDVVVDTAKWCAGKKVLVPPDWIERVDWDRSTVYLTITRAQARNSPEYDPGRTTEHTHEA